MKLDDLKAELDDAAKGLAYNSIQNGCADCGLAANLATRSLTAITDLEALVAENERLREEVIQYRRVIERLRDFDGWVGTYHAGHAYDAKQDALALLGAKP